MPVPILLAPLLIKGFCALCGIGGVCYCAKKVADAYGKHSKRQKERLALKGKSLEEAREDNKKAREEENKLKKELEKQEDENNKLENELEQARNKANDSTLSDEERAQ
jgi:septal ring factor EnvC (AmiA/AmiB activator)